MLSDVDRELRRVDDSDAPGRWKLRYTDTFRRVVVAVARRSNASSRHCITINDWKNAQTPPKYKYYERYRTTGNVGRTKTRCYRLISNVTYDRYARI